LRNSLSKALKSGMSMFSITFGIPVHPASVEVPASEYPGTSYHLKISSADTAFQSIGKTSQQFESQTQ
jgi:hypothetical protein